MVNDWSISRVFVDDIACDMIGQYLEYLWMIAIVTMFTTWGAGHHVWMELQSRTLCVCLFMSIYIWDNGHEGMVSKNELMIMMIDFIIC